MASLDALDKICLSEKVQAAQASGKFAVLFDSGIRTGSDIMKALALGAQGILRKSELPLECVKVFHYSLCSWPSLRLWPLPWR